MNGEKMGSRQELKDGDEIGIGATRLKFLWDKSRQEAEEDDDRTRVASAADLAKKGRPKSRRKKSRRFCGGEAARG